MNKSQQILTIAIILAVLGLAVYGIVRLVGGANGRGGTSNADAIQLDTFLTAGTSITAGTTLTAGTNLAAGVSGVATLWTIGGVQYASVRVAFTATSSIPAIIANPLAATSTLDILTCVVTGGNLGTVTFDLSTTTAAGNYGSSTVALIPAITLAAGDTPLIEWTKSASSTGAGLAPTNVLTQQGKFSPFQLKPADVTTMRIATATPSTYAAANYLTGFCDMQVHR